MAILIVGIDCATKANKVGLVVATSGADRPTILRAHPHGKSTSDMAEALVTVLQSEIGAWAPKPTLLALDAPLGWPQPLGEGLHTHLAGARLRRRGRSADGYFRRVTDRRVKRVLGKAPLEVGANFIARTGMATLELLASLGEALGSPIKLAWQRSDVDRGCHAIEVYPAATRIALNLHDQPNQLQKLKEHMAGVEHLGASPSEHTIDAALCVLAADHFIRGNVVAPRRSEVAIAKREGWIWCPRQRT